MTTALLAAACASSGPPPVVETPPAQPTRLLIYRAPAAPATLSYAFADTTHSNIQAGAAGNIQVSITGRGVADLTFEAAAPNQKVTLTFKEFAGTFSNSAGGGTMSAGLSDVRGPTVFTLTPAGMVTITQKPELTPAFRTVVGSENNFRRFFIRLPARAVMLGATWADTLSAEETNEGITSKLQNVVQMTYVRDTVIAGRTLAVLTGNGQRQLEVRGISQGVEIVQKLTGKVTSYQLWDPERNTLVLKDERAELAGTFDLPAMNMTNMPITATGRTIITLL